MATRVILLLYYISPIIYADTAFKNMKLDFNPMYIAVKKAIDEFSQKRDFNKSIKCELKPVAKFNLTEVRCGLVWMNKIPRRLKFWNELVPELMQWLSAEVIECGIYSEKRHEVYEVYRSINANRSDWINALQDLVYRLLKLISEVHNLRSFQATFGWFQEMNWNGGLNWLQDYESWYTAHEYKDMLQEYLSPLKYLQRVILNWFNITTWAIPKSSPVYVPKSPRRPIILVWPSVMNPALAEEIAKQVNETYRDREYLKIKCLDPAQISIRPLSLEEVKKALDPFKEAHKAPTFVPELIKWLSETALDCGFYTIFYEVREHIYRFIDSNRSMWVKALQQLVYTLVQAIAVIHNKTNTFAQGLEYGHLNWLEEWVESYEYWYKTYPTAREYLQKMVNNSLDIVTAWLYDYMAERTKDSTWVITNGSVCALENYDMVPAVGWDHMLFTVENSTKLEFTAQEKMKLMAETFMRCEVVKGCVFNDIIQIFTGLKDRQAIVRTPSPIRCTHICTDVPSDYKPVVYAYAHMTTVVGHDLHCIINDPLIIGNEVYTSCYPQVVEKYITDRQYNICKSSGCTLPCCKPLHLRPKRQPHCEIVTYRLSTTIFPNKTSKVITRRYPNP